MARRVTIWMINDRILVRPMGRTLDHGEEAIFEIDAEADDTVDIGDFKEVRENDFDDPPSDVVSNKKPFARDPLGPRTGPGEIRSGPAKETGRYKYTVTWTRGKSDPIVKDPWIII